MASRLCLITLEPFCFASYAAYHQEQSVSRRLITRRKVLPFRLFDCFGLITVLAEVFSACFTQEYESKPASKDKPERGSEIDTDSISMNSYGMVERFKNRGSRILPLRFAKRLKSVGDLTAARDTGVCGCLDSAG